MPAFRVGLPKPTKPRGRTTDIELRSGGSQDPELDDYIKRFNLIPDEPQDQALDDYIKKFNLIPDEPDAGTIITKELQLKPEQMPGYRPPRFKEPTTTQSIIGAGISTVPAIAGAGAGAILGGGVGSIPGMIIGGGAGSMMGSDLRQRYEVAQGLRGEVNPYLTMTEGAIGGLTAPIGGQVPGAGTGLKALAKYMGRTGLEGAGLNIASLPFTTKAETGEWRMPTLGEAGGAAGMGFGFGSATGGLFGSRALRGSPLGKIADAREPTQQNLDILDARGMKPTGEKVSVFDLPMREPKQENLFPDPVVTRTEPTPYEPTGFQEARGAVKPGQKYFDRYRMEGAEQQELPLEFEPDPTGQYPLPENVDYEPKDPYVPQGRKPIGSDIDLDMIDRAINTLIKPAIPTGAGVTAADIPGPFGAGEAPIRKGEQVTVYEKDLTGEEIDQYLSEGWEKIVKNGKEALRSPAPDDDPDITMGMTIIDPQVFMRAWEGVKRFAKGEQGSDTWHFQLVNWAKSKFRDTVGREGTADEIRQELTRQLSRLEPAPFEPTGGVATFPPRFPADKSGLPPADIDYTGNLQQDQLAESTIPPPDQFGPRPDIPPQDKWDMPPPSMNMGMAPPGTPPDITMNRWPPETGPFRPPTNQGPQVMNEPRLQGLGPMGEGAPPNRPGMEIPPEGGGLDVSGMRQRNLFPQNPEEAIRPAHAGYDQPLPLPEGQQELPLWGDRGTGEGKIFSILKLDRIFVRLIVGVLRKTILKPRMKKHWIMVLMNRDMILKLKSLLVYL